MEGGEYDRRGSTGVLLTHDLSKPSGSGRCCVGRVWAIFGGIVIALLFGSVCVYVTNLSRNLDPHITPRAETDHLASNSDHLASQVVQKALQDSTSDDTVDLILKVLQNINPTAINPNAVMRHLRIDKSESTEAESTEADSDSESTAASEGSPLSGTLSESAAAASVLIEERLANLDWYRVDSPRLEDTEPVPRTLYMPEHLCASLKPIVVSVLTLPNRPEEREMIRNDFKKMGVMDDVSVVFPLGRRNILNNKHAREEAERDVMEEAWETGDIVVGNFTESYEALPFKTMFAFNAIANECGSNTKVKWLIKMDVDVGANIPTVVRYLHKLDEAGVYVTEDKRKLDVGKDPVWIGYRWIGMPVIHSKNHRNFEDLDRDVFPPYTSGPFYIHNIVMSKFAVQRRKMIPRYFRNEDAMIGLLAENTDVSPNHEIRIVPFRDYIDVLCDIPQGKEAKLSYCKCDDFFSIQESDWYEEILDFVVKCNNPHN